MREPYEQSGYSFTCVGFVNGLYAWATHCLDSRGCKNNVLPLFYYSTVPSQSLRLDSGPLPECTRPADVEKFTSRWVTFGRSLLPWLGVSPNKYVIRNLFSTLATTSEFTAKATAAQQKPPGSPVPVALDNRTALDYLLAEQGGVNLDQHPWYCRNSIIRH